MANRRRRRRNLLRHLAVTPAAIIGLYLVAALAGSLLAVNRDWREPAVGTTVYLASNGIHIDLIVPVNSQGLDWRPLLPTGDFAAPRGDARWVAFGAGERRVYLETPRWQDIRPRTIWAALTGGERVMHVEWVGDPRWDAREIRLSPDEYRRLWSALRAGFAPGPDGRPQLIDHPGYGPSDAFYRGTGRASAIWTCNSWIGERLRIAGVRTSLWSPFAQGLAWHYRKADQST